MPNVRPLQFQGALGNQRDGGQILPGEALCLQRGRGRLRKNSGFLHFLPEQPVEPGGVGFRKQLQGLSGEGRAPFFDLCLTLQHALMQLFAPGGALGFARHGFRQGQNSPVAFPGVPVA